MDNFTPSAHWLYWFTSANSHLLWWTLKCVDSFLHIHLDQKHLKQCRRFTDMLIYWDYKKTKNISPSDKLCRGGPHGKSVSIGKDTSSITNLKYSLPTENWILTELRGILPRGQDYQFLFALSMLPPPLGKMRGMVSYQARFERMRRRPENAKPIVAMFLQGVSCGRENVYYVSRPEM